MKFTLDWLKEHLQTDATAADIAEALTDLGLEVEAVDDPEPRLGAFTICRVVEARPHPDADRLQVCRVETGHGDERREVQVVCGAPNARRGLIGVFAPPGTHIPGTGLDLAKSTIRGIESAGMLCSGKEMMISDDHDGIIDLPPEAPIGARFMDYAELSSVTFEIAVTPNRPDALAVRGIARDLAARGVGRMSPSPVTEVTGMFACPLGIQIEADVQRRGCPAFFGRVIRGVRNGPSPAWMQRRLTAIGLRPISALVDITNYVTFDRARPLHVFDADRLSGGLRIHFAEPDTELTALDGDRYRLSSDMMVISDAIAPRSIAGIIGGEDSSCSAGTVNVLLESALWDPHMIAATGRRLKITSDARYRFERGVDPAFTRSGLELATRLILDICGGEASEVVADGRIPDGRRTLTLRNQRVHDLVGMTIAQDRQVAILDRLGFDARQAGEEIAVTVPPWRPDIHGEADLVEEVARVASLAGLRSTPLPRRSAGVPQSILTPSQSRERAVRRVLAAAGGLECVTYSFIDSPLATHFTDQTLVRLHNPISSEMDVMRPDLLPGLLRILERNRARGIADASLFEVGPVFFGNQPDQQVLAAAGVMAGSATGRQHGSSARDFDIFDAKAAAEAGIAACGFHRMLKCGRDVPPWFHPGRSGSFYVRPGVPLGVFGELHPRVVRAANLRGSVYGFVIDIGKVPQPRRATRSRTALKASSLQAVERDFSFILDERVEAALVVDAVRASPYRDRFASLSVFDAFVGPAAHRQFGAGKKSLAISVRLQPDTQPFREADLTAIGADIVARVIDRTGGTLRS